MTQTQAPQRPSKWTGKWNKTKIVTVVVILVLASLAAAFFYMAWDYRGAKNRSQHTLIIDMTNMLATVPVRVSNVLDDGWDLEGRSTAAWWAEMILDRLNWDSIAVGNMYTSGSSTRTVFFDLAYAFDEISLAVIQAQAQVASYGHVEEGLSLGLEIVIDDLYLLYAELWDAMDKSMSWSDYPPSTVKYIDLDLVEDLVADMRAAV